MVARSTPTTLPDSRPLSSCRVSTSSGGGLLDALHGHHAQARCALGGVGDAAQQRALARRAGQRPPLVVGGWEACLQRGAGALEEALDRRLAAAEYVGDLP